MKYTRFTLFLSVLFCALAALGQSIPRAKNKIDKAGKRQGKWVVRYNKNWYVATSTDSVAYYRVIDYQDDKPKDKIKAYRLDGSLQWEGNLNSDNLDCAKGCETCLCEGVCTWYDEKGAMVHKETYEKGVVNGRMTYYYPSGQVQEEGSFANGNRHGAFTSYYPSGKIKLKGEFLNGVKTGTWQEFSEDGELITETNQNERIANFLADELKKGIEHYQAKEYAQCLEKIEPFLFLYKTSFASDKEKLRILLTVVYQCYRETGQTEKAAQMKEEIQNIK